MTAGAVLLIAAAQWAGLAALGRKAAKAMANPDAWVLPLAMGGVLGVLVMAAASYPWQSRRREALSAGLPQA